jgi:hypothetical protein
MEDVQKRASRVRHPRLFPPFCGEIDLRGRRKSALLLLCAPRAYFSACTTVLYGIKVPPPPPPLLHSRHFIFLFCPLFWRAVAIHTHQKGADVVYAVGVVSFWALQSMNFLFQPTAASSDTLRKS